MRPPHRAAERAPRAAREGAIHRLHCPVCGRAFYADLEGPREARPYVPFCSERCRAVDLGAWLDEEHRISEPLLPGAQPELEGFERDYG